MDGDTLHALVGSLLLLVGFVAFCSWAETGYDNHHYRPGEMPKPEEMERELKRLHDEGKEP
jgi:hypothetical protein